MGRPLGSKNKPREEVTQVSDTASNPANRSEARNAEDRKRIPMSVPNRRLEVPEVPGFHLHWFVDRNIPRALQAAYAFAEDRDVPINQFGVGTDRSISGNADLGSHIRVIAGTAEGGGVEHLTLMKIKEEYWREDQKTLEDRNQSVVQAIFKDNQIAGSENVAAEDKGQRYVKTALFNRPFKKAR